MWEWLQELPSGAATFVGALTGSSIGLIALLIGALFNARLNRKRDDRLRTQEMRTVAAALRAELAGLVRTLEEPFSEVLTHKPGHKATGTIWIPNLLLRIRLMPELLPKLGLLDVETIGLIIDAQIAVEQYCELLRLSSKTDSDEGRDASTEIELPHYTKGMVKGMNTKLIGRIQKAVDSLDKYLS